MKGHRFSSATGRQEKIKVLKSAETILPSLLRVHTGSTGCTSAHLHHATDKTDGKTHHILYMYFEMDPPPCRINTSEGEGTFSAFGVGSGVRSDVGVGSREEDADCVVALLSTFSRCFLARMGV